jgi:hypothetical protein
MDLLSAKYVASSNLKHALASGDSNAVATARLALAEIERTMREAKAAKAK